MSYSYTALVSYFDSDDRLVNLTQSPTVTAYNALTGDTIASATITNIRVGVYRVAVTSATLTDVLFSVVPHVDDQANHPDVAVMQEKVYHVADDIVTDISALNDISTADVLNATVEGTYTLAEVLRIMAGALAGKLSGGGTTTLTFRDLSDSLDRITATVNTVTGDRTAVTIDES
jgi:hypothetical protein